MTAYVDLEKERRRRDKASRSNRAPKRPPDDDRPVIRIMAGELERTVDQAERALIKADVGLYQRAGIIVGVGTVPILTAAKKEASAPAIHDVGEYRLLELMMSAAAFEKYDARAQGWVPTNAPAAIPKTLKERRGLLHFPILSGIVNAPTLRPDGSILAADGYDDLTGLLLDTDGEDFPEVPDKPTHQEARSALAQLNDLIDGFPFVSGADKSVALAAMLTGTVRKSLPRAPAFAFTAPVAGSGKSTLVDVMSVIATGREAGVIAPGKTEEETEKRLAALLLSGVPIAIDNAESGIGGDLLCQILTQQTVRMRVLGKSEAPELPTNVMVTVTGNNLTLVGDMTRRALLCRLDPGVERPELREFSFDPITRAKERRSSLLIACLTILRAYHCAGRPAQTSQLGSFGAWSDLVRSALIWIGQADPVDTVEQTRQADPKTERLRTVMVQWSKVVGTDPVTASDLAQRASTQRPDPFDFNRKSFINQEFREALLNVAGASGFIDSGRLGTWLGRNKGRVVDGMRIDLHGIIDGINRWQLVRMAQRDEEALRASRF